MKKRMLILNQYLSGVNKHIYNQLKKRNWDITIIDVPIPRTIIIKSLVKGFNLNIFKWKQNAIEKYLEICKTPDTFIQRTSFCNKKIDKLHKNFDLIFQISGLFSPTLDYENLKIPFVTFNDYTMALSKKYPASATSFSQIDEWMDLERKLYQNASLIFTTSENTKESITNDYNIEFEKVIKVRYGKTINYEQKITNTYNSKIILFIGRYFKQKGGYILLEAFKKVRQEIPDAKLIIVGVDKKLLQINQAGVEIYGFINDRSKIDTFFREASLFAMPSFSEAFGLVFLEAMCYKLPCIGTTADAMPEIIEDDVTGYLIEPGDVEDLFNKLMMLLKNPNLSKKMGEEGYEIVKDKYNWDTFGEILDKKLSELIKV